MKYIKTKDGIYEVDFVDISTYYHTTGWNIVEKDEILAQANTLKELCDGFYLDLGGEFDDTYLRRKDRFEFLKELALEYMRRDMKVTLYGIIKTSKGLIYVAKLNENGELVRI